MAFIGLTIVLDHQPNDEPNNNIVSRYPLLAPIPQPAVEPVQPALPLAPPQPDQPFLAFVIHPDQPAVPLPNGDVQVFHPPVLPLAPDQPDEDEEFIDEPEDDEEEVIQPEVGEPGPLPPGGGDAIYLPLNCNGCFGAIEGGSLYRRCMGMVCPSVFHLNCGGNHCEACGLDLIVAGVNLGPAPAPPALPPQPPNAGHGGGDDDDLHFGMDDMD